MARSLKIDLGQFSNPIYFVVFIWCVEAVNLITGYWLNQFGILPRTFEGLVGIPVSPVLHSSIRHALSNTFPLLILGSLVVLSGRDQFWRVTIITALIGGGLTWIFGRAGSHVGSSGLVFGYFGFLLAHGFWRREFRAIAIATIVVLLYGGLIWGIVPTSRGVSFEGHLFGLGGGIYAAWRLTPKWRRKFRR